MSRRTSPLSVRPRLHALEGRVVPATFTVTNPNDAGAGSLRQAILDANAAAGADIVAFDPAVFNAANPRTITLTQASGPLSITGSTIVNGPGPTILTVSGGDVVRVFNVARVAGDVIDVTLAGLTITDGFTTGGGHGAGIRTVSENLTLDTVVVTANAAGGGVSGRGGGVAVDGFGFLTVRNSTVAGNVASSGGAGIACYGGRGLVLENSTVSGNTTLGGNGGGISSYSSTVPGGFTIRNSTIANNTAGASGGGVFLRVGGAAVIQNSTITGNLATTGSMTPGTGGGGIALFSSLVSVPTLNVVSSIVAGNTAPNDRSDVSVDLSAIVNVTFSAVGDADGFTPSPDSGNNVPFGANLDLQPLGTNGGLTRTVALGPASAAINAGANPVGLAADQRGAARVQQGRADIGAYESAFDQPHATAAPFAPVTAAGGTAYTLTVVYDGTTPINVATLDANDVRVTGPNGFNVPAAFVSVTPSGNGAPRTATYSFPAPGGTFDVGDYGIYTVSLLANQVSNTAGGTVPPSTLGYVFVAIPQTITVTNLLDSGPGSLRQAVLASNATAGVPDTIVFQTGLTGTISLTQASGQLTVSDSVTIAGPAANAVTVNGGGAVRLFNVSNPNAAIAVTISGLTLHDGGGIAGAGSTVETNGGAIFNGGETLTLERVVVSGSTIGRNGGGIANADGGTLTVRFSTFSGNSSVQGGGIDSSGGSVLLENCTVSDNVASFFGGGVFFSGNPLFPGGFTARNTTIANNFTTDVTSFGGGVGVGNFDGPVLFQNCTVTGNSVATTSTLVGRGGGGIAVANDSATLTLTSTIVSGNTAPAVNGRSDIAAGGAATVTANFCAIGDPDGFTLSPASDNNLPFGAALGLGALANNLGPTRTVAIVATNSPLLNAGSNPAGLTSDQRGPGFVRSSGGGVDIGAFERQVTPPPPPRVGDVDVNAGQANTMQRSRVTSLTVTFTAQVAFAGPVAAAFTVSRIGGGAVGGFTATAAVVDGVTVVMLTGFTGAETNSGSLADGRYALLVRANQVSFGGVPLDGDGNGTAGDDFVLNGTVANGLYRLYGDVDADGFVNAADFGQFRPTFGSAMGQAAYLAFFDFDGDGFINAFDFGQFRPRFGGGVP